MGAPATDYFCENGHHIGGAPHHCFCELDEVGCDNFPPCPYCRIKNFACQYEWGDDDYKQFVPTESLRYQDHKCKDHYDNTYYKKTPIYDVKRLFRVKKC